MPHNGVSLNSPTTPPVNRGKVSRLRRRAEAFSRNAEQLNGRTTRGMQEARKTQEIPLSSRKVAWVEKVKIHLQKIKHRVIIGFNNMRLFCHFYSGQQNRAELKRSIDISKRQLEILNNQQDCRDNIQRARENFEDGQYKAAAKDACRAIVAGAREGFGRVANQLDT